MTYVNAEDVHQKIEKLFPYVNKEDVINKIVKIYSKEASMS